MRKRLFQPAGAAEKREKRRALSEIRNEIDRISTAADVRPVLEKLVDLLDGKNRRKP